MLEKKILEPGNMACESYLSKLRDVNIRFDGNNRPVSVRATADSPRQEGFADLPPVPARISSIASSQKGILQSFAQYREQIQSEFGVLKSNSWQLAEEVCSPAVSSFDGKKDFSCYSTEFAFEIPSCLPEKRLPEREVGKSFSKMPVWLEKNDGSEQEMVAENLLREDILSENPPETPETLSVVVPEKIENETPSLPENPFAQLLAEKKKGTLPAPPKAVSIGLWQQKLNCFAAAGIACGVVILGMAFCHANSTANVWNLGFSFSIAGVTSLATSGILVPLGKFSRSV